MNATRASESYSLHVNACCACCVPCLLVWNLAWIFWAAFFSLCHGVLATNSGWKTCGSRKIETSSLMAGNRSSDDNNTDIQMEMVDYWTISAAKMMPHHHKGTSHSFQSVSMHNWPNYRHLYPTDHNDKNNLSGRLKVGIMMSDL